MRLPIASILLGAVFAACGSSNPNSAPVVTIANKTFSPTVLSASPGATVTVNNMDPYAHTFTSEAAENAYTPGGAGNVSFDTGSFTGTAFVTIPVNAVVGTNVWFYCKIHTTMMNQGYIRVVASGGGGGY